MKKFIYAFLFAVLPAMAISMSSCSDDDNLPDVSVSLSVDNATIVDGTIYVVQGDSLDITGINVTNNQPGKAATITNVKYFVDGYYFGTSFFSPYPAYDITNVDTPVGTYQLGISCTVLAVDKSIAIGYIQYPIKVVASASDIPSAPAATSAISTMKMDN